MTVPIEIVKRITPDNVEKLREHLRVNYLEAGLLTPDVSTYAVGRMRAWLQDEAPLGKTQPWKEGIKDEKLWNWLKANVWEGADIGLVTYGPVGISPHRDASYAGWRAYSVNLGEVEAWWYEPGYSDYKYGPQIIKPPLVLKIEPGDVLMFNPKNRHAVINPAEDRWAINLWERKE